MNLLPLFCRKLALGLLLCGIGSASTLRAEPFVRWHGAYITSNAPAIPINLTSGIPLENGIFYPARNITPTQLAYDKAAPSAVFHGAVQLVDFSTDGDVESRLNKVRASEAGATSEANVLCFSTSGSQIERGHCTVSGLIFWDKSDFLKRANDVLRLADFSEFLLETLSPPEGRNAHFAVKSRGQWYLSENLMESGEAELRLADPASAQWEKWDFQPENPPLEPPSGGPRIPGRELNEIEAVGFYFAATYRAANRATFLVRKFQVE